jgi:hypothetical protein
MRARSSGLMDKAPSGGRDYGFESRLGLLCVSDRGSFDILVENWIAIK